MSCFEHLAFHFAHTSKFCRYNLTIFYEACQSLANPSIALNCSVIQNGGWLAIYCNEMSVVPVLRHSAEGEDLVDGVQCRSFRVMITGNAAVALLRRLLRVWRVVLLDGALSSARNTPITHGLLIRIAKIK